MSARAASDEHDARGIQSVALALSILESLTHADGEVGVSTLAKTLEATKSRVHRHLQTLVALGFVEFHPTSERYAIGPRIINMGQRIREKINLTVVGFPVIKELRDATGHLAVLSGKQGGELRVLASAAGIGRIGLGLRDGAILSPHASAQGKVAMACDVVYREAALVGQLEALTSKTITSPQKLNAELERIRFLGWSEAPGELVEGVNALAAPIVDDGGGFVGTVGLTDFQQYLSSPLSKEIVAQVRDAALRISRMLGHRPSQPSGTL